MAYTKPAVYTKKFISEETCYHEDISPERSEWLRINLVAHQDGQKELRISLYNYATDTIERHFEGTLNDLVELILLGKIMMDKIQKDIKNGRNEISVLITK